MTPSLPKFYIESDTGLNAVHADRVRDLGYEVESFELKEIKCLMELAGSHPLGWMLLQHDETATKRLFSTATDSSAFLQESRSSIEELLGGNGAYTQPSPSPSSFRLHQSQQELDSPTQQRALPDSLLNSQESSKALGRVYLAIVPCLALCAGAILGVKLLGSKAT